MAVLLEKGEQEVTLDYMLPGDVNGTNKISFWPCVDFCMRDCFLLDAVTRG